MKIAEVREQAMKYNREQLMELLVTAYKMLPKQKKEEMDRYIIDLYGAAKKQPVVADPLDFESLKQDILEFVDDAQNQYYFAPNRKIPKQSRSRWRFTVRKYLKALFAVPFEDANAKEAGQLLLRLFNLLSQACGEYLFSTEDPFGAVGYGQNALYSKCAEYALKADSFGEETIKEVINSAVCSQVNYDSLNIEFEVSLINLLDENGRNKAIMAARELVQEQRDMYSDSTYDSWDHSNFRTGENIQNLIVLLGMLHLSHDDLDTCLSDYWKYTVEKDKEIALYVLLMDVIRTAGNEEMFAAAYEDGIKKRKIKPRKELKDMYAKIKANQKR